VDRSLAEGISEARSRGARVLHVSIRKLDWELPLGAFDSSVEDAHYFGGAERAVLGVGVAKSFDLVSPKLAGLRARRSLLELDSLSTAEASKVMVMGGWGFPAARGLRDGGIWNDFPPSRWVIPALTLNSSGGEAQLALVAHVRPSSEASPLRAYYRGLLKGLEPRPTDGQEGPAARTARLPPMKGARRLPSPKRWLSLAQEAIDSISRGELKKVVLSRAEALTFGGKVPASVVLRRLIALNPDSTVFAIKRRGSVFLGATPESLVSVRKGEVKVDCLAASSPRGRDRATDDTLGARLLKDPKSSREHRFVVQAAVGALSPICSRIEVPGAPVLKKLTTIQHLYTPVKGTLLEGEDVWAAALALWPNPAIGGEPKAEAVSWIRRFEGLNRGWYSGVVGTLNLAQDEADLVVAIRSGLIRGRKAVIYAGAGLVAGSDPREELEETGWKLRTMRRALGLEKGVADDGGR
jgi:menaquinone-specific isochorismate synthase